MTVKELYQYLDRILPRTLSCPWDNDGMMCCPSPERAVRRVLISLDVTDEVIDRAIEGQYDVILTHHPMIFKPLPCVEPSVLAAARAIRLIRAGVAVMSFHTRLDAVSGGVNDTLAELLGLCEVTPFGCEGEAIGRIGSLDAPVPLAAFAKRVKTVLSAPAVTYADAHRPVKRVAVLGGSGKDDVAAAIAAGADTYLSGELGHHALTDAPDMGINLIEAGHFYTEYPILHRLQAYLAEADSTIESDLLMSCRIHVI